MRFTSQQNALANMYTINHLLCVGRWEERGPASEEEFLLCNFISTLPVSLPISLIQFQAYIL